MLNRLNPHDVDVVVSHYPCTDGFASRLACWVFMKKYHPEKEITYYDGKHGGLLPDIDQFKNKNVLICDFSYRKDFLLKIIGVVNNLLIIDHHKSAEKDLADIDDRYKIFDMNHSGAYLTWTYFFPEEEVPLLIKYVEDRDIWTKKLPNTDSFASWFYTLPFNEEIYAEYLDDTKLLEGIEKQGKAFQELNSYYTKEACNWTAPKFSRIGDKYYFVAYVNSTVLKSDIGNAIFEKFPLCDFSVTYSVNDWTNTTSFSLRSTNAHVDVSVVAFSLGGGGHRNASGAGLGCVSNTLPGVVYDNGRSYFNLRKIYFDKLTVLGTHVKEYNVVYMNNSVHKTKFGKYLLQDKYTTVQECRAIESVISKQDVNNERVQIAAIWDYDGLTNVTDFSIVLDSSIEKNEDIIKELTELFGADFSKGLRYPGLIRKLDNHLVPLPPVENENED